MKTLFLTVAFTSLAAAANAGGDCCKTAAEKEGCCAAGAAACAPMFESLKKLEGRWESADADNDGKPDVVSTYKVTSAGSAVVETLFPGEEHEMITMYHLDGDRVLVTHYCALGNQPRLKSTPESAANKMVFAFDGGANIDSENGDYMGALTFEIVDDNTIKQEWTHFKAGQRGDTMTFNMKRTNGA